MSKIEVQKIRITDEKLLMTLRDEVAGIVPDREIDSYEKSVWVEKELDDEVEIVIEGYIVQPFITHQVVIGDREATEQELLDQRWTEFEAYAIYKGDPCRFELLTDKGLIQDTDLEDELI